MSFTHRVLGLCRECSQAGVEVELKLWFRESIEYFNFSNCKLHCLSPEEPKEKEGEDKEENM